MGIGGMGISSESTVPSDLEAIYQGGDFFLDRMKAMRLQQAATKTAMELLNLGQDIGQANNAAKAALESAQKARDDAAKILSDAKTQAANIIATANTRAGEIVDIASNTAIKIKADSDASKKQSDDYAAQNKVQADAALKDARDQQVAIAVQTAAAEKAEAKFIAAKAAQEAATQAANDAEKLYRSKVAQLQAVIA